ncbi:MAG: DapH/DapD/GlmU-related protein, partial [Parasphingorhabdus sp.]
FILLDQISNDNAAGEYYLPDIVMLPGQKSAVIEVDDPAEVAGVNSRAELAAVEGEWQARRREKAMADGVSLIAPDTVWFSHDTQVASDVVIEPNVIFGPGVSIASGAKIYGHSHIEGATIGSNTNVGPFARLRPGAVMEEGSKVGNFVEMKKAILGKGAKANHLTYLGDAEVGEGANIGAGTITCNYDGYFKYKTVIGKGAFIGSNSALVAPVTIGDGAIVGAGATVTKDVSAGDLALVRAEQTVKTGWADRFNAASAKKKAKETKS